MEDHENELGWRDVLLLFIAVLSVIGLISGVISLL